MGIIDTMGYGALAICGLVFVLALIALVCFLVMLAVDNVDKTVEFLKEMVILVLLLVAACAVLYFLGKVVLSVFPSFASG